MGNIIVSTNLTLDGVVQDPDGKDGFARGGWFDEQGGEDLANWGQIEFEEAMHADALLLGRTSDEWFASRWGTRSNPWADRLNSLPKYVISSTLEEPKWANSTVLGGDVVADVTNLREHFDGEIVVYASYLVVRTLIEHNLVDGFRLFVFPVVLGAGDRLFGDTTTSTSLRLITSNTVGKGLVFVEYEVVRGS